MVSAVVLLTDPVNPGQVHPPDLAVWKREARGAASAELLAVDGCRCDCWVEDKGECRSQEAGLGVQCHLHSELGDLIAECVLLICVDEGRRAR